MINKNNFETKWHKLDNTANVFPIISNKSYSSVYRVSVTLKNEIEPDILQEALIKTLPLFDSFRVRLRHGAFWYYFENNKKTPLIEKEQTYPCAFINPSINNHFLFKVTYFGRRINLEVFHVITDGTGAFKFLKALTYNYIKLENKDELSEAALQMPVVDVLSDLEDSYRKNYKKLPRFKNKIKSAYKLKGEMLPILTMGVLHGYVKVSSLQELCRKKGVTITQYVSAIIIWCIYKEYLNEQSAQKPIQINIPVNLRGYFNSTTETNFFSYINVGIAIVNENYTLDDILTGIVRQFNDQLTKENLLKTISYNVSTERNILVRCAPLVVKNVAVKLAYLNQTRSNSLVLSNLGKIEIIEEYKKYIENFNVLIGVSKAEPVKCSICSFNDTLVFTFTSILKDTYLQRAFFRCLADQGIDVSIESNGVYNEEL